MVENAREKSTTRDVATAADVVPSTATGIVDNLVVKGLVSHQDDPNDRRRAICRFSPEGQAQVNKIWTWGHGQIETLLDRLTMEQLRSGYEATEILANTAGRKAQSLTE